LRCGPTDSQLGRIFEMRREILLLRKNIIPVRDLLNKVQVEGTAFQENTKVYLKDLSDHVVQVTESLWLSMEISNVLIDTYHSMQNQRMNAVMKTLTMISTVFLPLNFIAGVYGMNFKHMPELEWIHGYPMALAMMFLVSLLMVIFFIHKGWLWEARWHRLGRFDWLPFVESQEQKQSTQDS
jgi:magnesium transporter